MPPWKRTRRPLPFWARRAAFLVDEDDGATGAECYRRPPSSPDERLVRLGDRRRGSRRLHPAPSGRAHRDEASAVGDEVGDGGGELLGIVGSDADPSARLVEEARDRRPGVDGGEHRPPGGEDRVRLRRDADLGQATAQRHDVQIAGGEQLAQAIGRHEVPEPDVRQPRRTLLQLAAHRPFSVDHERDVGKLRGRRRRPGRATARSRRCRRTAPPVRRRSPARARYRVIRSPGRICLGVDEVGDRPHLAAVVGRELAADVGGEIVGQHGDGVGQAVADPLQPRGRGDDARGW